jgi:hypothetical protein
MPGYAFLEARDNCVLEKMEFSAYYKALLKVLSSS